MTKEKEKVKRERLTAQETERIMRGAEKENGW